VGPSLSLKLADGQLAVQGLGEDYTPDQEKSGEIARGCLGGYSRITILSSS
jgi:hypothetical protein